jgi:hypothetical protein
MESYFTTLDADKGERQKGGTFDGSDYFEVSPVLSPKLEQITNQRAPED